MFDTIEEPDGLGVIHESRDGTIERLRAKRSPDPGAEDGLGGSALETDGVEGDIIRLASARALLIRPSKGTRAPVPASSAGEGRRGLLGEDLGVLDEIGPFERVELLEVLQQGDSGRLVFFPDDLTEGEEDLLGVVRGEDGEGGHAFDGERLGHLHGEGLSEEGYPTFGLAVGGEELPRSIGVGEEERCAQGPLAVLRGDLLVEQLGDVFDGKQVLAVHGNHDGVPNLRDKDLQSPRVKPLFNSLSPRAHLWLILDPDLLGRQQPTINPLGQLRKHKLPTRPHRQPQGKGPTDTEHRVPNDVPKEGIQEEQDEIHTEHDRQRELGLMLAQRIPKELVGASTDDHGRHGLDRGFEGPSEEEVRFHEFAHKDDDPDEDGCQTRGEGKDRVRCRERLRGKVLSSFASDAIPEHPARGNGPEEDGDKDPDSKMDDGDDQRDFRRSFGGEGEAEVNGRGDRDAEDDDEEE